MWRLLNTPLKYNLLLGWTWFYKKNAVVSSVFRVLRFPDQGKIVKIDQLAFCTPDLGSNVGSNLPFVDDTTQSYMKITLGMFKYPLLMGNFPLPPPSPPTHITPTNIIYFFTSGSLEYVDPWVVLSLDQVLKNTWSYLIIFGTVTTCQRWSTT
jgi:hypothetical protein